MGYSDFISREWFLIARGQTHTNKQTRILTSRTKAISRNQAHAGLWLAHAWFKKCKNPFGYIRT